MSGISRRVFVGGVSLPFAGVLGCGRATWWDLDILHAMAGAVLPSELGTDGASRVVHDFTEWADGIRTGAELNHGYGTADISYRTESPVERWAGQLHDLNAAARSVHVRNFAALEIGPRRELIASALTGHDRTNLPSPIDAPHVAIAVMAFFAHSPEGTDLAYGASVKTQTCRPLNQSAREPVQLPGPAA